MRQGAGLAAGAGARAAARLSWAQGAPLGRPYGFPVYLSPSWLLLAIPLTAGYGMVVRRSQPGLSEPLAYLVGVALVSVLVASVLAHELGHALTCRHFGIGVRAVTLEMLGGYTELDGDAPSPRVEATVSLAGPGVSLVLGLCAVATMSSLPGGTLAHQIVLQVAASNLVVAGFNLLPAAPLDGGRALQALVWAVTSDPHRGHRAAGWTGAVLAAASLAVAATLYAVGTLSLFVAALVVILATTVGRGAFQALRGARLSPRSPAELSTGEDGASTARDHPLATRETSR